MDMRSKYTRFPGTLVAVFLAIAATNGHADDMYKTVDAEGHVTFSDHPLSSASQRVSVEVTPANAAEAARLTREQAAMNAQATQEAKQARQDASDQATKAAKLAQQQQRCAAARARYAMFAAGGRIFRTDEQGNRVYYSDEEIDQQRMSTKAAMESACNF
jgi:hypothetical protein